MSYTHDTASKTITQSASTTDNDFSGAASLSGVDKRDVNNNGVRPAFNYEIDGANTTRLQINGTQTIDPLIERLTFVNQPRDATNSDGTGRTNTGALHNNPDNSKIKVGNGGVLKVGLTTYPDDFQPALTNATWLTTDSNWADPSANATVIYIEDGGRLEYNYGAIYCDLSILRIRSSASGYMKNALIVANMESNPITLARTTSILVESNNFEFDNCRFFGVRIDTQTAAVTLSNVGLKYGQGLILRQAQANVREHSKITCSTTNNRDFYCTNSATTYHCRNTSIGLVGMRIGGSGTMRVRHGVDFAAKDSLGNGINGLTVICNDNQGTLYSVNLDSNGESTAETLITLGLATSSGQTFYSDNSDDVFTFKCFKYGQSIATIALTLNGLDNQIGKFTMFDDALITESNKATVDSYTEIDTSAKFYDRSASYLEDNLGTYTNFIVSRSGNQIDAGSYNVTIDATASSAFDITGNLITIKASTFTGDMVTTGLITLANGAIFNGVRTDANGTIEPDQPISITNIVAGSRMRIYNVTTGVETVNTVVSGTSYTDSYQEGTGYNDGDVVRVYLTKLGKKEWVGDVIDTSSGFNVLASQIDDDVYSAMGVDGSTVTKFVADYPNNQVDIQVAQDFSMAEFYTWWSYNLTTESGVREFFGGITPIDQANLRINHTVVNLFLDNTTSTNLVQTDNRRIYRTDGVYPVIPVTSGGGGIDIVWRNTILIAETGLNAQDSEDISDIVQNAATALTGILGNADDIADTVEDAADAIIDNLNNP